MIGIKVKKYLKRPRLLVDDLLYRIARGKIAKLPYPPRHITIPILGACTNRCIFCCHHSVDSKEHPISRHLYNLPYRMSFSDFCRIVDIAYQARVPHIHIVAAGEAFLHPDIFKMIDYVIEKYGEVSFQTNFNRRIFDKNNYIDNIIERAAYITCITTDIMSSDPKKHEEIKKGSKYEDLLEIMQEISEKTDILFDVHLVLTKYNYHNMDKLVEDLCKRKINFRFSIVNLHPHNFNNFTSIDSVYNSDDSKIRKELEKVKNICKKLDVPVSIPEPFDKPKLGCIVFWSRLQMIPSKDLPKDQWIGNALPGDCNAVVIGKMRTLGNLFDYKDFWDLWNNEILTNIRKNLIRGKYPDAVCKNCQHYLRREKTTKER